MSKNIVFEGWLTKSPPSKRIWRTKWRRRWFLLRQSGELPGQYFLDYYADRNCRRLKGTINLDFCEQVDAGLHMERSSHASLKPRLRGSVFTIQTQTRTYHLQADCEADMEKWVDAICRVCGLRATDEESKSEPPYRPSSEAQQESIPMQAIRERNARYSEIVLAANNLPMHTFGNANEQQIHPVRNDRSHVTITTNAQIECAESTGPYIPISECITGVRVQDVENKFTFDPKNMVKIPIEKSEEKRLMNPPQIRINNIELSENESNFSEDECRSLNPSQSTVGERSVSRSFTKMSLGPKRNVHNTEGPPVPPRPPKSFTMYKDIVVHKDVGRMHKHQEPESTDRTSGNLWVRNPRRKPHGVSPPSTSRSVMIRSCVRTTDDEEDAPAGTSMQYYNITSPPPPVIDRGLKPRYSTLNPSNMNTAFGPVRSMEESKPDKLQYLDLDLPQVASKPSSSHSHDNKSSSESEPAYKTVDFLKTEAFNITRQDAEASRSVQQ